MSRCGRRRGRTRRGRRWRRRRRIIDAHFPPDDLESLEHFPPRTKGRNALRLERLLAHHHRFLPGHTLEVRRVLVQSERAEPSRDVVQYCRVKIFFAFLRTPPPLFPPAADELLPLALWPGERPPDRPGPPRPLMPLCRHPASTRIRLVHRRARGQAVQTRLQQRRSAPRGAAPLAICPSR